MADLSRESCLKHVYTAVEEALNPSFHGPVPEPLLEAVAKGNEDPERVRNLSNGAVMDLVRFDSDRIAGFVFDTSRPPIIQGGSTILNEINDHVADESKYKKQVIFSGGGEGLLLLPAGEGSTFEHYIKEFFQNRSAGALSVTTATLSVKPEDFLASGSKNESVGGSVVIAKGVQAVLSRLGDLIQRQKGARFQTSEIAGNVERCMTCQTRVGAVALSKFRPDREGTICRPCDKRWVVGSDHIKKLSFEEMVETFAAANKMAKSGYMGFIYTDGNSMGKMFHELNSLAELRYYSQAVNEVFVNVSKKVKHLVTKFGLYDQDDPKRPMHIELLGGGDEKIFILPAALALLVCAELPDWIEQSQSKYGFNEKLTVGTGLVIADHKYPMRSMYEMAKSLQKNAKARFYKEKSGKSYIDFEVVADNSPLSEDLESARERSCRTSESGFLLTTRPYRADEMEGLLNRLSRSDSLAKTQLYQLRDSARMGSAIFNNFACYQVARNTDKYRPWLEAFDVDLRQPKAINDFFIYPRPNDTKHPQGTWLGDAVMLAPFTGALERRDHAST